MSLRMRHFGVVGMGPMVAGLALHLYAASALADVNILIAADFGDGVLSIPDGNDDLLVRDSETGLITILYLGSDGQELINQSGEVTSIEIVESGHGYSPTFEVDEHGLSHHAFSSSQQCFVDNRYAVGKTSDWAAFLVDGEEGTPLLEFQAGDSTEYAAIDHERGAVTRILFAHENGGSGYEGTPGLADELRCRQYTHGTSLVAPITTWNLPGAELGKPVALAAPDQTQGVQFFHMWQAIPGGGVGEGYPPNVGPPGLLMELVGGTEQLPASVIQDDEVDEVEEPSTDQVEDEVDKNEVDEDVHTEFEGHDSEFIQELIREQLASIIIEAALAKQADEPTTDAPRLPEARVLTDADGRLTHVLFDPGTQYFETPPLFVAPETPYCDGRGVLQVKLQGQINYVDLPGEHAGDGYSTEQDIELFISVAGGGGQSLYGVNAVVPLAEVARGEIIETQVIGDPGLYQRPPRIDIRAGAGRGADLRCRLGHEGTGLLRFNGTEVSMGANWTANTADFDLDGDLDLLWFDQPTGRSAVWKLGPDAVVDQLSFGSLPSVEPSWTIGAVGEFDPETPGANIFWRNTRTGENAIWGIDASKPWSNSSSWLHEESSLVDAVEDTDWVVIGANRGGNRLLWWNRHTGICAVWTLKVEMTAGTSPMDWLADAQWLTNSAAEIMATDPDWIPQGYVNLAGRASGVAGVRDVLWMESDTTQLAGWLMKSNFARVDAEAIDGGANYIDLGFAAEAVPGGRITVGQYISEVSISRAAGGDGSRAPRAFTNLFWSHPDIDGTVSCRLSRRIDPETGLLKDPWAVEQSQDVR